jgi:hypothetical protein
MGEDGGPPLRDDYKKTWLERSLNAKGLYAPPSGCPPPCVWRQRSERGRVSAGVATRPVTVAPFLERPVSDASVRAARTSMSRDSASLPSGSLRRRGHGVSAIEPPTELDLTISVDWGTNASLMSSFRSMGGFSVSDSLQASIHGSRRSRRCRRQPMGRSPGRPISEPSFATCRSLPSISGQKLLAPSSPASSTRKKVVVREPQDDTFADVMSKDCYPDIFD